MLLSKRNSDSHVYQQAYNKYIYDYVAANKRKGRVSNCVIF